MIANTEQIAAGSRDRVAQPIGFRVPIQRAPDGTAYLEIRGLAPCEVLVLTHHP